MVAIKAYPHDLQALLATLPRLNPVEISLIERAYHKAEAAHEGQKRKSGEPYFTHCVAVASILADVQMDAETIAAALLHDVIEDTSVTLEELQVEFNEAIARMVEGVTKLTKLKPTIGQDSDTPNGRRSAVADKENEYFRKMFLTMGNDVRVVLVKLADRLHNMRTLGYMPENKRLRIARETKDIFAPLAGRLGIWQFKWELEDLSFRYLEPDTYRAIATRLDEKRVDREKYVKQIAQTLREALEEQGIHNARISSRPKHIYSIYRKMERKNVPLEQVYDVRAVRVIVNQLVECYTTLGIVHGLWSPVPGEFDDYIAVPKNNLYRSLHTAVIDNNGKTLEVQIRTDEMHEDAEYGIAAHWRYKEGSRRSNAAFDAHIEALRRSIEAGDESDEESAASFLDRMKSEVFLDRIYVFTPKGDIIDLPAGATPVDFAYHIHTEIGHRCRGAKVHGKLEPLNYTLKTGDQVEVTTTRQGGPSLDWLNESLGYVKTERARAKIRHYFRRLNREKHLDMGRNVLERELKRLSMMNKQAFEDTASLFDNYQKLDDFLIAIGKGEVTGSQITARILENDKRRATTEQEQLEHTILKPRVRSINGDSGSGISIMGTEGFLVNLAKCCNPMAGDEIVGYITRGRGVTVHRTDCVNMRSMHEPERLLEVEWSSTSSEHRYTVPVEIIAHDREGLLSEISTMIADAKINISSMEVFTRNHVATLQLNIDVASNHQLARILSRIEQIRSVVSTRRVSK